MRLSAVEWLSACASVLATMKSTPCTSDAIMLAIALPPAPPTPITLMRGFSSSTSGRMNSIVISLSPAAASGLAPCENLPQSIPQRTRKVNRRRLIPIFFPTCPQPSIALPERRHQPLHHARRRSAGGPWSATAAIWRRSTGSDAAYCTSPASVAKAGPECASGRPESPRGRPIRTERPSSALRIIGHALQLRAAAGQHHLPPDRAGEAERLQRRRHLVHPMLELLADDRDQLRARHPRRRRRRRCRRRPARCRSSRDCRAGEVVAEP